MSPEATLISPRNNPDNIPDTLHTDAPMAAPIYPTKFDDVKIADLPAEPQVKFSFVVAAPKKYVWDSWHLPQANGGDNIPITKGTPKATDWPGVVENMERNAGPATEVVGKIKTPASGDWVRAARYTPSAGPLAA